MEKAAIQAYNKHRLSKSANAGIKKYVANIKKRCKRLFDFTIMPIYPLKLERNFTWS